MEDKMRGNTRIRFGLWTVVLLIVITSCSGQTGEEPTLTPAETSAPEQDEGLTEEAETEGEEAVEEETESTEEEEEPTPTDIPEPTITPAPTDTATPVPSPPVAILVVDDFLTVLDEEEQVQEEAPDTESNLCTVTPEGQIFRGEGLIFRGEGLTWKKIPGVSHGELVYSQLEGLISDAGYARSQVQSGLELLEELEEAGQEGYWNAIGLGWIVEVSYWVNEQGQTLLLVAVDTDQYDYGVILERVWTSMEALIYTDLAVSKFVWNMSFGFIPCDLGITEEQYQQLLEDNIGNLQAIEESLYAAAEEGQLEEEDIELFLRDLGRLRLAYEEYFLLGEEGEPDSPPLPAWLVNDPISTSVVITPFLTISNSIEAVMPVASSGNSGLAYPFAPAVWPGFVSVSSEDTLNTAKYSYSNNGEVMMPDSYNYFGDIVAGTSFAAPRLSFLAAQYLLAGGSLSCVGATGTITEPPFDTDVWANLSLIAAKTDYCPGFPP